MNGGGARVILLAAARRAGGPEPWGQDQQGRPVTRAQLVGHWLLINYWAEWCAPCRAEIGELNALAQQQPDLQVLGVNFDGLQGKALFRASQQLGIRFRVLASDPGPRLGLVRSPVLPVSYLLDERGVLREQLAGPQTAARVKARLAALRAVSGPASDPARSR